MISLGLLLGCLLLSPSRVHADAMEYCHPGDVFIRMDKQEDGGGTAIYRLDVPNDADCSSPTAPPGQPPGWPVDPPQFSESIAPFWDLPFASSGLSIDKFERVLTVKKLPDSDISSQFDSLTKWQYADYSQGSGWITRTLSPFSNRTFVGDPTDGHFYVPELMDVVECQSAYTITRHNGGVCGNSPPASPPGIATEDILNYRARNFVGFKQDQVIAMDQWFLSDEINGETAHGDYKRAVVRAISNDATAELAQPVWYALDQDVINDPGELTGLTGSPQDQGNPLQTRVTVTTDFEVFPSCGDFCLTSDGVVSGGGQASGPPVRILFGSEGTSVDDQKAYTLATIGSSRELQRLERDASDNWVPVGVATKYIYPTHGGSLDDAQSFGNAASLESLEDDGDDFLYASDVESDHFAVSSRFWRTGGTFFTYDAATGVIRWVEHAWNFDGAGNVIPTAYGEGERPQGTGELTVGTGVYAITADGAGNVYWLFQDLDPANGLDMGSFQAPDHTADPMSFTPDDFTPPDPSDVQYSDCTDESDWWFCTSCGLGTKEYYYAKQCDREPVADNPDRPPYYRAVRLKQHPSYRLWSYNFISQGHRADADDLTDGLDASGNPVTDRGSVARGTFEFDYRATCPQAPLPPPGYVDDVTSGSPSDWSLAGGSVNTYWECHATTAAVESVITTWSPTDSCSTSSTTVDIDSDDPRLGYHEDFTETCTVSYTQVRTGLIDDPLDDGGDDDSWEPPYDDSSIDFTDCETGSMPSYAAYSSAVYTRTWRDTHSYKYPVTECDTSVGYTWSPVNADPGVGPINPSETSRSQANFDLDLAAVNVTEPPALSQPDTVIDVEVNGSSTVVQDTAVTFHVENAPVFEGAFTGPQTGSENSNYPDDPVPASWDTDGDGLAGFFGSNVVSTGFQWRWRIRAVSSPLRYAYTDGAATDPNPLNNGLVYVDPASGWYSPSDEAPAMNTSFTFRDPGRYEVILDVRARRWSSSGVPLTFFSRPEDVAWTWIHGVHPAGERLDEPVDPALETAAFEPNLVSDTTETDINESDLEEYNSALAPDHFARIIQSIQVRPDGPICTKDPSDPDPSPLDADDCDYVVNIAPGPDLEGDTGPEEDVQDTTLHPAGFVPPADSASDDVTDVYASFDVHFYRAKDYAYDEDLEAVGANWGAVEDTDVDAMTKLHGVGTFFRTGEPGCDASIELATDYRHGFLLHGVLGSVAGGAFADCQTHVALEPRRRDWQDIGYTWYVLAPDPGDGATMPTPPTAWGWPIASGTLAELWDLDNAPVLHADAFDPDGSGSVTGNEFRSHLGFPTDLLVPRGSTPPENRSFTVTLPLYGKASSFSSLGDDVPHPLFPLEIIVPTDPESLRFTCRIEYPRVQWQTVDAAGVAVSNPADAVDVVLEPGSGGPNYGIYQNTTADEPTFPDHYFAVEIRDKTPSWADSLGGLDGITTAPAGATLATTSGVVTIPLLDNNPYSDTPLRLEGVRYTIGTDDRLENLSLWATTPGVGLQSSGGRLGFDLSFDAGNSGSLLASHTAEDYNSAGPRGTPVWKVTDGGDYELSDQATDGTTPAISFSDSGLTGKFRQGVAPVQRQVSDAAPADWIKFRSNFGSQPTLSTWDENHVRHDWEADHVEFPVPTFAGGDNDSLVMDVASGDLSDNPPSADDPEWQEGMAAQTLIDSAAPNVIVEIWDTLSGRPVYWEVAQDFRRDFDSVSGNPTLPVADGVPFDQTPEYVWVSVSQDQRPIMAAGGTDLRRTSNTQGRFFEPGSDLYDFRNLSLDGSCGHSDCFGASSPAAGSLDWSVEEDVEFRVRVIASDNATPPEDIGIGVRSIAGLPRHGFPTAPSTFTGSNPSTVTVAQGEGAVAGVTARKAFLTVSHRYPLEGLSDAIEVVVRDEAGNERRLQFGLRSWPHETDFRVISDRIRRGSD